MAVLVLGLGALLLILAISEATLNIRAHLAEGPVWLGIAWWGLIGLFSLSITWLLWRLLRPSRTRQRTPDDATQAPSEQQLESAMDEAAALGTDTRQVQRELAELRRRRETGEIHVVLFGEISTGKSALIRALLPDAEAVSDVRGGTTRQLKRYRWTSPGGDELLITDMPGTAEADGTLDRLSADEARRAHVVVYVTDSDLNRTQHAALQDMLTLQKPLLLVLNKTDRYSEPEAELLSERLRGLVQDHPNTAFASVSAAGSREVLRVLPDGSEQLEQRPTAPRVGDLARALQRLVDGNQALLDRLRDSATFVLAARQLDEALAESRRQRADKLVDEYAFKAVVGALAAITPGADLVIQGWLGTQLIRELAAVYDTRVGKVDSDLLLRLVQQHVGRAHTLLLAVSGNALKAFPGIGTLAGGALHAIAYGIIFRTLGRALSLTLATRGELHPMQTARLFEERLGGDLETSARDLARVVATRIRKKDGS